MEPAVSVVDVETTPSTPLSGQKRPHTADHDNPTTPQTYNYTYNVRTYRTNNCFDSGVALLQGAGPGLPNMDFLLEDFGHRLVPRKCISVGRSFSLWAPVCTKIPCSSRRSYEGNRLSYDYHTLGNKKVVSGTLINKEIFV